MASRSKTSEKILIELEAKTALFEKRMAESAKLLQRIERNSKSTSKALAGMGKAAVNAVKGFIALAGIRFGTGLITEAYAAADAIGKAADATGLAVQAYQEFEHVAAIAGVSQGLFNSSMVAFVKRVGEAQAGTGPLVSFLKKYDQALLDSIKNAGSQEEALNLLAEAVKGAGTATEKAALANAAFGRSGVVLVNMLSKGKEGMDKLRESASTLDETAVRSAEHINDAWEVMSSQFKRNLQNNVLNIIDSVYRKFAELDTQSTTMLKKSRQLLAYQYLITKQQVDAASNPISRAMSTSRLEGIVEEINALDDLLVARGKLEVAEMNAAGSAGSEPPAAAAITKIGAAAAKAEKDISVMGQALDLIDAQFKQMDSDSARSFAGLDPVEIEKTTKAITEQTEKIGAMAVAVGNSVKDFASGVADSLVDFALTGEQSFADMTKSILANLAKMILQMQILKALGGTSWGSAIGIGTASLSPAMAAPGVGTFGTRAAPSAAGITAGGGGSVIGGAVNIIVNNNAPGVEVKTETKQNGSGGKDINLYIEKVVADFLDSGGADTTMGAAYGARRLPR